MFFEKALLGIAAFFIISGVGIFVLRSKQLPNVPDVADQGAKDMLKKVASQFADHILFDSNRSGSFGIYVMAADGTDVKPLVDTPQHEMYPDASPDGSKIVFARAESTDREAPAEIWLVERDGSNARKIASNGTFPTFSSDGQTIYFERDRNKVIAINVDGSNEREIFPAGRENFKGYAVVKPRLSADGKRVFFTSDKAGRWNAWSVNLETNEEQHISRGCEPVPFSSGDRVAWISKKNVLSKSGIAQFNLKTGEKTKLQDAGQPRGHEYFPSLVKQDNFLLYSACSERQHSHITSNYQIFIKNLENDAVAQVTFDAHTNRWPKRLPAQALQ